MADHFVPKQVAFGEKPGEMPDGALDSESFSEYVPISELPPDAEFVDPVRPHIYHRPFFWVFAFAGAGLALAAVVWLIVRAIR